jgi:hypothetical protein
MPILSGSIARSDFIPLARWLICAGCEGQLRVSFGGWNGTIGIQHGVVRSASIADEQGPSALELIALFASCGGQFAFEDGLPSTQSDSDEGGPELWSLLERLVESHSDLTGATPHPDSVPRLVSPIDGEPDGLPTSAHLVLLSINGQRNVHTIAQRHGLSLTIHALNHLSQQGVICLDPPQSQPILRSQHNGAVALPPFSTASSRPRPTLAARLAPYAIGLAVIMGSVALAWPGYQRILKTLLQASAPSQGWGLTSFVDLGVLAGLVYWVYPSPIDLRTLFGEGLGAALAVLEGASVMASVVLAAYALVRLPQHQRAVLGSLAISYAAALAYFRFVNPYTYAYLKTTTFAALAGLPLIALGLQYLWTSEPVRVGRRQVSLQMLAPVLGVLFTALVLLNSVLTTAFFFDQTPSVFTGSVLPPSSLELRAMAARIPRGASVFVGGTPLRPEVASAIAFFLRDHPLYGEIKTLESNLSNPSPANRVPDFGVLAASQDPADEGFEIGDLVWSNADVKLYRRGAIVAHHWFKGVGSESFGPEKPLVLNVTAAGMTLDQTSSEREDSEVASRQLVLELATLEARTLRIQMNGQVQEVALPAGLSRYSLESIQVPAQVTITPSGISAMFLRTLSLRDAAEARSSLVEKRDVLVVVPTLEVAGPDVHMKLRYAGADLWRPGMAIGVNVGGSTVPGGQWAEFGWWSSSLRSSELDVDFDLAKREVSARTSTESLPVNSALPEEMDGDYVARLNFWEPFQASLGWHSPFFNLFAFQVRHGDVFATELINDAVLFMPLRDNFAAAAAPVANFDAQVEAIRGVLPRSSQVMLSPALRRQPQAVAAVANGLPDMQFYADYLAGAQYVDRSDVYDFAILAASDDASAFGYQPQDRLLATSDYAVYRRGAYRAHLQLGQDGHYPRLVQGDHQTFYTHDNSLSTLDAHASTLLPAAGAHDQITLTLASLAPTTAVITLGDGSSETLSLPGGVSRYQTHPTATATSITIAAGSGNEPVFLVALDLGDATSAESRLMQAGDALVLSTRTRLDGTARLGIDLRWAGGGASNQFFLGLNLNGTSLPNNQWFPSAWWGVTMTDPELDLELDLAERTLTATANDHPLPVASTQMESRDGDYTATLSLWEPGLATRGWPTPFIDLLQMQVRDGHVVNLTPVNAELTVISLAPASIQSGNVSMTGQTQADDRP